MSSENPQTTNNIPQPDPTWDYYIIWHKLFKAKNHLDKLVAEIAPIEYSSTAIDQGINNDLDAIIGILSDTYIDITDDDEGNNDNE
ncbi:hypothetical protein NIES21_27380 [Anabaenopsis circularis NIES-21]|uniref:Uncharacterized protein n=1 Tax=Anabaenopsis circularis NIES-21 TaxID=1085406 RepID=A0A1Z4GHC9_9CYAN|nr:hypothetical protein NIES21_27380 [Anabaenopsis circularis NIES-21]